MIEKKIEPDDYQKNTANPLNEGISYNFGEDPPMDKDNKSISGSDSIDNNDVVAEVNPDIILFNLIGENTIKRIKEEKQFVVPFTDDTTDIASWFTTCLKTYLKPDEIALIQKNIVARDMDYIKQIDNLKKQITELQDKLARKDGEIKQSLDNFTIADSERKLLRRDLLSSVPVSYLIDKFLANSSIPESSRIAGLLKEEMENPQEGFIDFVQKFLESWSLLCKTVNNTSDDVAGMEEVHISLTAMLESISGISISHRRPILDIIAEWCSSKFKIYKFISPEGSLQVDPRIHSATALGGSTISEGISFAVLRKDNLQTVKYAEIKVQ